ncbi:unnamed protein product [Paramecium pentaurelia]|uniref:Uncharacterized protein n=1 Tax=Paramecium pentaurelia TaxID=43138 RepID=A0A8S1YJD8_9CILI|nr:unnamed protein product [Paramecium pentaurelia]
MPKLGEVLAQIGSIVNIIMLLKILSNMINTAMFQRTILHQIIEISYPQFKVVYITKNFLGQVKQMHCNDVEIKLANFQHKYKQLLEIASKKFAFNNLIKEISQIYNIKNIFKIQEDLKFFESELSNSNHQIQNLVSILPGDLPKQQEFERFELFNSEFPL